jgi:DHA1 family chloramphenicol resistance protein-like MFS transporter
MLSGLLPPLAEDLGISIPQAGLLISAFGIGMVFGAPLLTVVTIRLPRRATLIALLLMFALGHVVGAVANSYAVLFATRVVSAFACAGFWAVGATVAISMVPVTARAKAMAVMMGGLSVANIAGVPGGALLGQHGGWRVVFWAVALMTAVAIAGVVLLVPRVPVPVEPSRLGQELRIYRDKRVWFTVLTMLLVAASIASVFSYLASLLKEVTGLGECWLPFVLTLYGVGALAGTLIGGRIADAHLFGTMYGAMSASVAVLALIALLAKHQMAVVALSGMLGMTGFATAPSLNALMFNIANTAKTLASVTITSSFNIGNTIGPWVGGLVINAGLGYRATAWAGAVLAVLAMVAAAGCNRMQKQSRPRSQLIDLGY